MRKTHLLSHPAGVVDVDPGTASALFCKGRAVIIQLQGHADDVIAFLGQLRRDHGTVDAARHGDDHAGFRRRLCKSKGVQPRSPIKCHGSGSDVCERKIAT